MRDKERERVRGRSREKQAPCREPDGGLDPGTPASRPGLKAGAKRLSPAGIPNFVAFQAHGSCINRGEKEFFLAA